MADTFSFAEARQPETFGFQEALGNPSEQEILSRPAVPAYVTEGGRRADQPIPEPSEEPIEGGYKTLLRGKDVWFPTKTDAHDYFVAGINAAEAHLKNVTEGPTLQLPTMEEASTDSKLKTIGKAAVNVANRTIETLSRPENLNLMAGIGGAPRVLQRLAAAGFSVETLRHTPELIKAVEKADTLQQKLEAGGNLAVNTALGALAAKGAMAKGPAPEIINAELVEPKALPAPSLLTTPERPALPAPSEQALLEKGATQLPSKPTVSETISKVENQLKAEPPPAATPSGATLRPELGTILDVNELHSGLGIIPGFDAAAKAVRDVIDKGLVFYAQPLTDRLAAEGGTAAKGFANMAREMTQRTKALFGTLSPTLDPALQATGRLNKATTWLNDIAPTNNKWGYRNAVSAVEGPITSVPTEYRPTVDALKAANLDIGRLAMTGVPGFVATGKYQRMPTAFLVDTIRSGRGDTYDLLVRALSRENRIPETNVRNLLEGIKAEFDAPGSQQTVHRIAQEFERKFPKFPTDLKIKAPIVGEIWMPILHATPFDYLSKTSLATAQRVAFLERIPRGNIGQIRQQVVKELKTPDAFDDLVRALHGLPLNKPFNAFPPGSPQAMALSGVNRALSDVFASAKLTVSAIYNIGETFLGNTPAFLGWKNFVKGAAELPSRHANLEALGAITRNFYNWSFDPKSPVRSVLRDYRLLLRKGTAQQFFNELQEKLAASTAQVFAEQAQGGMLSPHQQGLFTEAAVAMGFQRIAAKAMAEGRGSPEQYGDFTRRASAFTTGGNILPPETSRMAGNRILNSLFRFQSYPMMKLNSFRQAYTNFFEAVGSGDAKRVKASSEQLAKFLFGTTAQGAATLFLAALLTGRGGSVQEVAENAKEHPGEFMLDSIVGGMGGPVSALYYVASSGRPSDLLDIRKINPGITFPGSIYMELMQMFRREGPYAGMTVPGAIKKYLTTKVPAGKAIQHALEATGLVEEHEKAAQGDIYRWIRKWAEDSKDAKIEAWWKEQQADQHGASKYAGLRDALSKEDYERAKKEYETLQETVKLPDIIHAIANFRHPFTGARERENDFKSTLTPEQLKRYDKAKDEREQIWERFQKLRDME